MIPDEAEELYPITEVSPSSLNKETRSAWLQEIRENDNLGAMLDELYDQASEEAEI